MHNRVDLSVYSPKDYHPGRNKVFIAFWFFISVMLVRNPLILSSSWKVLLFRLFGAKIGKGVVIKQGVSIKYPWRLKLDDHIWIGENVWIDNLVDIEIGRHTCLSQGSMLLTGNHDYKKSTFDLITGRIIIEEGVWIGAKSIVCPGVRCKKYAVLTAGSVACEDLEESIIYQGNPASGKRNRWP